MTVDTPSRSSRPHYLELSIHPASVAYARNYAKQRLAKFHEPEFIEIAQLITSELVTNALKAVRDLSTCTPQDALFTVETVGVNVYCDAQSATIEAWDSTRQPPVLTTPDDETVGGRGLYLVNILASQWGYRWPKTGGKIVWAHLQADAPQP